MTFVHKMFIPLILMLVLMLLSLTPLWCLFGRFPDFEGDWGDYDNASMVILFLWLAILLTCLGIWAVGVFITWMEDKDNYYIGAVIVLGALLLADIGLMIL